MEDVVFIVDCMLGRLAKWLRILGFDAWYFRNVRDEDLIAANDAPGRILLTRDKGLLQRAGTGAYVFVKNDTIKEQLLEVIEGLNLPLNPDKILTRCLSCNGILEPVPYDEVLGKVPDFVFSSHKMFSRCKGCGKIYWAGSHKREIRRMIQRLSPG